MALAAHWKKVAGGIGLYFAGLIAYQQYQKAQAHPEQANISAQRRADEWQRWDEAKEAVRKECLQLGGVSLDCQNSYQVRGVDRETSMAQCASSIEAYKECVSRKADVDSRRKWMEMRRKEGTNKQRSSANT